MQARSLKRINYPVAPIILGTSNWGEHTDLPEARSQFRTYLQAGGLAINLTSTNASKSMAIAGELLAELTQREEFQIHFDAEKFSNSASFTNAINRALGEVGIDHFDVVWFDTELASLEKAEYLSAINRLIVSGKVLYFGIRTSSFWKAVYLNELLTSISIIPAGLKIGWSLLQRDLTNQEYEAAKTFGLSIVAERVLALGLLSGKYRFNTPSDSLMSRGNSDIEKLLTSSNHAKIEAAATAAEGLSITTTELSLSWLLSQDNLSAMVVNSKNTAQLNQILNSLQVKLPDQMLDVLNEVADFG
jgi:aryl-alcohol dehydrogenase-like predicted oxidoreductase